MSNIEEIMNEEFKRKNIKYRIFFTGLLLEKYFFKYDGLDNYSDRGILLRNYYFLMRYLDDIIDDDINIKNIELIDDRIEYLEEKLYNVVNNIMPKDEIDSMIYECHLLANKLGFSLKKESKLIMSSLIFDGKRISEWNNKKNFKIVSKKELDNHYYNLDIIGTISGCLKIFREKAENIDNLYYLGTASRKYYDIRDFVEDVKRGLVNISFEELSKYNITESDLIEVVNLPNQYVYICKDKSFVDNNILKVLPESILNFLLDSAKCCEENLKLYNDKMKMQRNNNLRNSTRLTLNLGYAKPIEKYLSLIKKYY